MSDPHDHSDKFRDDSPSVFPSFAEPLHVESSFPLPPVREREHVRAERAQLYLDAAHLSTAVLLLEMTRDAIKSGKALRECERAIDNFVARVKSGQSNSGPAAPIQGQG